MPWWATRLLAFLGPKEEHSYAAGSSTASPYELQVWDASTRSPWFVPKEETYQLIFFQRVFKKLLETLRHDPLEAGGDVQPGVPLVAMQRCISRLFLFIGVDRPFNAASYDLNGDGMVGWWEFCMIWAQEGLVVRYSLAERIYLTLEDPEMSRVGYITSIFVLLAIVISAGSFIISTLPSMQTSTCSQCEPEPYEAFTWIDTVCVILFTIEYLLRLVTSAFMRTELINNEAMIADLCTDEILHYPTKLQRVRRFACSWPNIIDLLSILPTYFHWLSPVKERRDGSESGGDSTMVLLKLTRLMRVVRAFRLGRRFQAVIVIAKAMRRSARILWVLVLNLSLNMLVFGAIMFFVEQGDYDPETQQHLRPGSWVLNNDTNTYKRDQEPSPFESIPHAFWWALVTATTVGYGDMYPTTDLGKVTAGIATVWSLCVLALPVGVIGANFEKVWEEYDTEKRNEVDMLAAAKVMEQKTRGSIDPLSYSRRLLFEVFHDSGMATQANDIFIGEVEIEVQLEPNSSDPVHKRLRLVLQENLAKSRRKVRGELLVNYSWTPCEPSHPGTELEGTLAVTIVSARGLVPVDWKGSGLSDPYVALTLYPRSPSMNGSICPEQVRTKTVFDDAVPVWNETKSFAFHWHKDGVQAKRECDRRTASHLALNPALMGLEAVTPLPIAMDSATNTQSEAPLENDESASLLAALPQLQDEVAKLREALPELRGEVRQLREDAEAALEQLGLELTGRSAEAPQLPQDLQQASPKKEAADSARQHFPMPGSVPDEASPNQQ